MRNFLLIVTAALSSFVNGEDCVYNVGKDLQLDLSVLAGEVLTYSENNLQWTYSICSNALRCLHTGESERAMVEVNPIGINECRYYSRYNRSVQPFYDFAVASWIFNYSNGELCPDQNQQENRTTTILWNCNPLVAAPFIVDIFEYDTCNAVIQIDWKGACVKEPVVNERCMFYEGLKELDLSSIKGDMFTFSDEHNLTWTFSPCANAFKCRTSHGTSLSVMSEIMDTAGGCIKFLGVWAADVIPFYKKSVAGDNYWEFFWMDGEECGAGGPLQVLNVRYYCNPKVSTAVITSAGGVGPCSFRIELDSKLACVNETYVGKEGGYDMMKQMS